MTVGDWGVRPLLLAVETDPTRLARTETELARSFGASYRVRGEPTASDALRLLEGADARGEPVGLVAFAEALPEAERRALLASARSRHPEARRCCSSTGATGRCLRWRR
ncbi:MAG: hypothetical protein ACLGHZ_10175 [Actinomycetes bacterium]